jgi:thiol:disulfide interchange protein DsbD
MLSNFINEQRMKRSLFFILFCLGTLWLQAQVLDPIQWKYKTTEVTNGIYELVFTANIENKWHLYSQHINGEGPVPTTFTFKPSADYELVGTVKEASKGEKKFDENFGFELLLYSHQAVFVQKIKAKNTKPATIVGSIKFMCCDDRRCLPPKDVDFSFNIPAQKIAEEEKTPAARVTTPEPIISDVSVSNKQDSAVKAAAPVVSSVAAADADKEPETVWGFFFYALLMGLLGVLTPCVYPMIPMTVSFFMRSGGNRSKGILLGLIFGLSIVAIYTLIGVLVSLSILGADVGNVLSTHWIPNTLFFLLFIIFAASFFGMFEMVLPSSLVNKIDQKADKGGYVGAFFMALTLVIVSFSCTGPIVGKLLIEASRGLSIKPIAGMFGYSLAFALPFTLFALFPSMMKSLPKSGGWLNAVKVVLGFFVAAFSLTFVVSMDQTYHLNLLSRDMFLIIWIVLSFLLGMYLLGKLKLAHDSDLPYIGVPRLFMAIIAFSFSLYLFTGLLGSPLKSIGWILPPQEASVQTIKTKVSDSLPSTLCNTPKYADFLHLSNGLNGYFDLSEAIACAKAQNKPVFLDIKGHSCKNCKKMETEVWTDSRVMEMLSSKFVIVALYVDEKYELPQAEWITSSFDGKIKTTIGDKNLDYEITRFGTNTQPLYAVLDHNGNPLNGTMGLNTDVGVFLKFLQQGEQRFRGLK